MFTQYLKENKKPKFQPYHPDWQKKIENPAPIMVKVEEDQDESCITSEIDCQDVLEVMPKGFNSLEQTFDEELEKEQEKLKSNINREPQNILEMLSDVNVIEHVPVVLDGEKTINEKDIISDSLLEVIQPKNPKLPFQDLSNEVTL